MALRYSRYRVLLGASALLIAASAEAAIVRCTSAAGKVAYQDRP